MSDKSIAIITARGGSKRIPKKNIKDFNGKPIIAYSIQAALESNIFDEVMVSTDSEEIADIAREYGAKVPFMRSEATSNDTATTADVLKEVLATYKQQGQEFEYMTCIYPTAPFVTAEKLKKAMELLKSTQSAEIMTVVKYSSPPQRALTMNDNNCLVYAHKEYRNVRSQDLKPLYYDAGQFYMYDIAKFFAENGQIESGIMPLEISELEVQDIDNYDDWKLAELKYTMMKDKQKKVGAIIGVGSEAVPIIKKARERGVYTIGLDGNKDAEGLKYVDKAIWVDILDKDAVCKILKDNKVDFVIPVPVGSCLSTMGWVNEHFNFKGINYEPVKYSVDKYLFHNKLHENGLRNIDLHLVNKDTKLADLNIEYPAILKPRFGSGSRDVFFIDNDEQLDTCVEQVKRLNEDFVLEQVVDGTEYGLDGVVIDGKLQIVLLRKKINTPKPIRQAISSLPVQKVGEGKVIYDKVYEKIDKVIRVLNYNNCFVNADLIINDKGVFVIEIASRPAGHSISSTLIPLATGIDMTKEYLKWLMNEEYSFEAENIECLQMRFFDFSDVTITKVPTKWQLSKFLGEDLISWNCNIKEQDYMNKVVDGHSIMNRGFFVVRGKNETDLLEKSAWVLSQFDYEDNSRG